MNHDELAAFVTDVADDLAPTAVSSGAGLGALLSSAEAIADDNAVLGVMVTAVRMGNIASYLLAAATARAEAIGIPVRNRLKNGRDLLRELPLTPATVNRVARLAQHLDDLPNLVREVRDGDLTVDHADAVIRGLDHIATRMGADGFDNVRAKTATTLLAHARIDQPAQVMEKARELGHELAPLDPPSTPPADNPSLNQASISRTDEGRVTLEADLDQLSGEKLHTALDALAKPIPAPDGSPDPRPRSQRTADALVAMISSYLASRNRPTVGGIVPHITMTVPLPTLLGNEGGSVSTSRVARLGFTGSVSAETAREIACGSSEVTALITADSVPLDAKRTQRFVTGTLRKALEARDGGCQFPGCGRPPSWCEGHHIQHWADGGETNLKNTVLLCSLHHHTYVHGKGWNIQIGFDGHPWFQSPEGGDWIRCHNRRTLTLANHAAA
ncbi:HNH endonuclease signature motif containing protein [Gordonia crocea]|uniref:HNH endonuclease n=1 Tax=Gordonia crocea TaxID=589162 RepID=A0A7I9UZV1_9ACTN|nr:HNH endonuclease signature motif containing protein [Gordonia crocea]GED98350.1 HNH endonuclease [Gordonia crocea]